MKVRRCFALLLTLVIIVMTSSTAFAANPFSKGQCTWYAYQNWTERLGYEPKVIRGNAGSWYDNCVSKGYARGTTPKVGAIACWNNGYGDSTGHVAIVDEVASDYIVVSEYNWSVPKGYSTAKIYFRNINRSTSSKPHRYLKGYIYLPGTEYDSNSGENTISKVSVPQVIAGNSVSNGTYRIVSALNPNYCLDIYGGNYQECANAQIYNGSQTFNISYQNNGCYKITSSISGQCLDVEGGEVSCGKNVIQYPWRGHDNQQWIISKAGDGYYYIASKENPELFLDVYGGNAYSECNVDVWTGHTGNNVKWKLVPVLNGTRSISDGDYRIESALNSNYCLDIHGATKNSVNAEIYPGSQTFHVTYLGNGYYKIIANCSGKSLDVSDDDVYCGANVIQYSWKNSVNQNWVIRSAGNGYYYIISRISGLYLDVYGGSAYSGCNVDVWVAHNGNNEKWKFVPA